MGLSGFLREGGGFLEEFCLFPTVFEDFEANPRI